MNELNLLNSKIFKSFGALATLAIIGGAVALIYNRYISNKVLTQQSKINKYILEDWKRKTPNEIIDKIENNA